MNKLMKYTDGFIVSRPIFRIKIDESGSNVRANSTPIYQYRPQFIEGDVLSKIVCQAYDEGFSPQRGTFRIDKDAIVSKAMGNIRAWMVTFIEKNLRTTMRSPRQSKLYRWAYRNMPRDAEFNDGLIMLFKYAARYAGNDTKIAPEYKDHLDNIMAILDAMKEKYEQ